MITENENTHLRGRISQLPIKDQVISFAQDTILKAIKGVDDAK